MPQMNPRFWVPSHCRQQEPLPTLRQKCSNAMNEPLTSLHQEKNTDMDWPTILIILGTGVALAAIIVPGQRELRRNVGNLRERMARLEGTVELLAGVLTNQKGKDAK